MSYETDTKNDKRGSANLDPITDEPGAHPIGTGVGAALGGAAVGAIAGGLAGKAVAEEIDPTMEEAYWRENFETRPYGKDGNFGDYGPAYDYGVRAYQKNAGRKFDDIESELGRDWDVAGADSTLDWDDARHATRDSYHRLSDSASRGTPHAGNRNNR